MIGHISMLLMVKVSIFKLIDFNKFKQNTGILASVQIKTF